MTSSRVAGMFAVRGGESRFWDFFVQSNPVH